MFVNTFGGVTPASTGTQFGNVLREAGTLIRNSQLGWIAGKVENDWVTSILRLAGSIDCTFRVWLCELFDGFVRLTVRPLTPTYGFSTLPAPLMVIRRRRPWLPPPMFERLAIVPVRFARHASPAAGIVSQAEFSAIDRPAGAGVPSEVIAVAVVMFFITVLPATVTSVASSIAMPPPSCVEMLLTIWLLVIRIGSGPSIRSRTPPPSSFERFDGMTWASIVTAPERCVRPAATGRFGKFFGEGICPAMKIPAPSSYEELK